MLDHSVHQRAVQRVDFALRWRSLARRPVAKNAAIVLHRFADSTEAAAVSNGADGAKRVLLQVEVARAGRRLWKQPREAQALECNLAGACAEKNVRVRDPLVRRGASGLFLKLQAAQISSALRNAEEERQRRAANSHFVAPKSGGDSTARRRSRCMRTHLPVSSGSTSESFVSSRTAATAFPSGSPASPRVAS